MNTNQFFVELCVCSFARAFHLKNNFLVIPFFIFPCAVDATILASFELKPFSPNLTRQMECFQHSLDLFHVSSLDNS